MNRLFTKILFAVTLSAFAAVTAQAGCPDPNNTIIEVCNDAGGNSTIRAYFFDGDPALSYVLFSLSPPGPVSDPFGPITINTSIPLPPGAIAGVEFGLIPNGDYIIRVNCSPAGNVNLGGFGINVNSANAMLGSSTVDPDCAPLTGAGNADGSISLNISGGVAPYNISWPTAVTPIGNSVEAAPGNYPFPNLDGGDYTVEITDANNCMVSLNIAVPVTTLPLAGTDQTVCGTSANLSGNAPGAGESGTWSGTAGVTFSPDANTPNAVAGNLSAGSNILRWTIKDLSGTCPDVFDEVDVTFSPAMNLSAVVTDVLCNGSSTGAIDLTIAGGSAPFTFVWSNGAGSEDLSNIPAGTYSVTVTDAVSCPATLNNIVVTEPAIPVSGSTAQVDVLCFGASTGSITITGAGGVGPYDFSIDGGATYPALDAANHIFPGLAAGNYNLMVRDANGCETAAIPVTITEPAIVSGSTTQVNVTCFGSGTGSVTITGAGGVGPYDFSLDGGVTYPALNAAAHTFPGLAAGNYNLKVRDANGCETAVIPVTITEPAIVSGSTTQVNVLCFGSSTGSITITGAGGVGPYDFSIDGGSTYPALNAANNTFPGLAAGNYNLRVRDANNCETAVIPVTITAPATGVSGSTTQVDVLCFGSSTGSITITGAGGVGPYDFSIDGGTTYPALNAANNTFPGLPAGNYNLRVRDANNCETAVIPVTITAPAAVTANITQVNVTCFGASTGSVTITGAGGVGPYDFSIDGGATYAALNVANHTFPGLAAGNYNLRVRDANNCESAVTPVTITEPASAVSGSTTQVDVLCFGSSTGSITITGAGGTGPYDFSIDGGATYPALNAANHTFPGLTAGNYNLKVRDANNCETAVIPVTLTEPAAAVSGSTTQIDVTCFGASTGSITITGAGGVGPYDFSIDGGTTYTALNAANHTFPGLAAGNYNLRVRDDNNCETAVIPVTVAQPVTGVSGTTTQVDVACFGTATGSITITGAGGVGPYDFSIDGGATYPVVNVADHTFSGLAAGSFNLKVRDANTCESAVIPVTISEPAEVSAVASANGATTICLGSVLPDIIFTFTGVAPYDFTYTDGTTPVTITGHNAATFTIVAAPAGTYSVTALTDDNGCVSSNLGGSIAVVVEPVATVNAGSVQTICSGGMATLTGSGVSGSAATGAWSIVTQPVGGDGILSDGTQTATPSIVTFTAGIAGDYTLRLTTDDPAGSCEPVTDDVVITVVSTATVEAGGPQTICAGATVTLAGSFTGTTGATWTTSGDGSFDDVSKPDAVYTPGITDKTNATVTLTLTTAGPCAPVNDNVVITIDPAATVDAGSPQTICSTSPLTLNGSFGGTATGLIWTSSGNGSFDDDTDPNATYTAGSDDITNGSVILTATVTGGCAGIADNVTITIDQAATIDAGPSQTICLGSSVDLDGTLGGSVTGMTWTTAGDGSFNSVNDPDAVYTPGTNDRNSGTVTLTATSNNPAGPCPAAVDNVVITFTTIAGDETTAGSESWIGYVYTDAGDLSPIPAKINFASAKYRGFIDEADIVNMSPASAYDPASDIFDLNLGITLPMQGPDICGTYLDEFSVRYKMNKTFTPGVYRFTLGSDDGARLLIDNVTVIDIFTDHPYAAQSSAPICLSGMHSFEIQYFETTGHSRVTFDFAAVAAPTVTSPVALCVNSPAPALIASSTDGDVQDFKWYKGATLVFTGASYTPAAAELDVTATGSTTFTVTAVYACGESPSANVVVEVVNSASLTIIPETICETGGVVDLRTLVDESPAGGTFVFSGHPNISGNDFDPAGLAGNTISITVDYSIASCAAVQGTLDLTISNAAAITVPATAVTACESAADIDLTTLVSASPPGGTFTFSGTQVAGNFFDPTGLSGSQTITVDYSAGGCTAPQTTFQIDVTASASITTSNFTACANGPLVNLLTLVSAAPSGGSFSFTGTGVSGTSFNPSGQLGNINISVTYDANGCTANGIIQITVLSPFDPLCTGGGGGTGTCATVVIVPKPEPATCTNSDGKIVFSIKPFVPAVNNTGVKITIAGISSTNMAISRTNFNDSTFNALPVGSYDYTIEYGDPSCIKTGQVTIDQSGTVGTPVASNVVSPLCVGSATGAVTIDVPGETGNVLQWSYDGGITDPFKPFTAGSQITGIPAGPTPTFEQVISVRRNVTDPCFASVRIVIPETHQLISATFTASPATCNGNDGAITNIVAGGGSGSPYSFSINGGLSFQSETDFNGLSGGTYTLRVKDGIGCENDFTANVTFPGFINSTITKNDADCSNGGSSGSISVTVNDMGAFEVALSTDQSNEPDAGQYQTYLNPSVTFSNLLKGQYFVYIKSGSVTCPTRSAPINILGVYDINFEIEPSCNGTDLSITLHNVTGEPGGAPLEIQVSKKLSTAPPEIIYIQFPADGEIFLDYNDHTFLKIPGEYRIKIIQFQNEVVCNLSSEIVDFTVPSPLFARVDAVAESYPDIPTGKLQIAGFVGGLNPYDIRIELDSASSFSLPFYETNFEEPGINSNQQFEKLYEKIPAGRYVVEVVDSLGCSITFIARVPLDTDLFVPNVFTPNGDGSNDVFFVRNLPTAPSVNQLIISNRWGKEVFVSENYQNNWDGEGASDGIYYYRLKVENADALTGWLEIIRGPKP